MSKKRLLLTLCPIYLFLWMGDALLTSYYALYFIENGLVEWQQSLLLGIIPFSLFLGCIVLGHFAKNRAKTLWLFRICAIMETGLALCYAFCNDFPSLLVVTIFVAFFNGAPFTFIESHAALALEGTKIRYSSIRMFGTLGYIVSLGVGALLLKNLPFRDVYFFSCGFFAVCLIVSFLLKPLPKKEAAETVEAGSGTVDKKGVALLLVSLVLFLGAFGASEFLLPVRLKELGLPDADYSLIRAIGIVGEFAVLLIMPFLHRFFTNKKVAFFVSGTILVVATGLVCFVNEPYALAYSNLVLTGFGKAFMFAYQVHLFENLTGKDKLGKILTLNRGLTNVVVGSLNLSSSSFYLSIGFPAYFGIITALEIVGLVILIFVPKGKPSPETSEGVTE